MSAGARGGRARRLCTMSQTLARRPCQDRYTPRQTRDGGNHMLLIAGVATVLLIAAAIIPRMWVPGGVNAARLGWMSAQWLAEHCASHSP